jgi:hypothetical protein
MKINPNRVEVKYALELYSEIPGFPSHTDILYVLIRSLEDQDLLDKDFYLENVWGALRNCVSTSTKAKNLLDEFCSAANPTLLKVSTDKKNPAYKLLKNPWSN